VRLLRRLVLLLLVSYLPLSFSYAQQREATRLQLDETHLLLDGALSDKEVSERPFTYNSFREAVRHFSDETTLYIAPYVYWVDNPDSPKVVKGKDGREPFGIVIRAKKLHFIGLDSVASHTVLASQRGQTQGAVGNFTMFDFHVDSLKVENLTMGNFCNVDLDYPLRPALSRKKRNDAITQAHVGYVHGRQLIARNVRFISRLNLNPLNGADRSFYEDCHFECTDDALNGTAIYRHCEIDLYGQKPFWSTFGRGAMFIDCDFNVKSENREMYFCKQGGPLTLIDCRYHAPSDSIYIGWTPYPQPWLRCYQHNFTLNGVPYTIGSRQLQNTVSLKGNSLDEPPYLELSPRSATLLTGKDSLLLVAAESVSWRIQQGYEKYVRLSPQTNAEKGSAVRILPANFTDEIVEFCIEAFTEDGRVAASHLTIKPSILPPPAFLRAPKIRVKGKKAVLDYQLDLQGRRDCSKIAWFRNGILVSVSHEAPQRSYLLSEADKDCRLTARIVPKHQRSGEGTAAEAEYIIRDVASTQTLETDFHDFPCQWQPEILPGYWTVDGYKPADTAEFPWSFDKSKPMWEYGKGFNGAVGSGLLQAQRGARLMYTPLGKKYGDMRVVLCVDPTKTAGQGFGSATGQYMDVCLKFDPRTLTGYGLRIIRTTKHAKAVDFLLVAYENGKTRPVSEAVSATCYRTGCTISLIAKGTTLIAHVETLTPQPSNSSLPHSVDLSATIPPSDFGGFALQHTGSCGESTTMLHKLKIDWE